mmetsp:Transcript_5991/g.14073  ORF Transcript_5991/g.14073 Transcript_5991/m.14073 type:complete len:269 (-) Transcript_5991:1515-2321(-)
MYSARPYGRARAGLLLGRSVHGLSRQAVLEPALRPGRPHRRGARLRPGEGALRGQVPAAAVHGLSAAGALLGRPVQGVPGLTLQPLLPGGNFGGRAGLRLREHLLRGPLPKAGTSTRACGLDHRGGRRLRLRSCGRPGRCGRGGAGAGAGRFRPGSPFDGVCTHLAPGGQLQGRAAHPLEGWHLGGGGQRLGRRHRDQRGALHRGRAGLLQGVLWRGFPAGGVLQQLLLGGAAPGRAAAGLPVRRQLCGGPARGWRWQSQTKAELADG